MRQEFTAEEYLKIDIANSFGLDKANWEERIAWFDMNQDKLEELVNQADQPAMFYAGMTAWYDYQSGLPIGYPISLDATSSGLQILACLTHDKKAMELCNVVDVGHRVDAYKEVYHRFCEAADTIEGIDREKIKKAIMTSLYSSQAKPKEIFGDKVDIFYQVMNLMAPRAWELNIAWIDLWNPKALTYDWIMPDNFHVHTKVMDSKKEIINYHGWIQEVIHKENIAIKQGRSLSANTTHSIDGYITREMVRRCDYNPQMKDKVIQAIKSKQKAVKELPEGFNIIGYETSDKNIEMVRTLWKLYEESGMLSARILQYLDDSTIWLVDENKIEELVNSMPKKPFKLITIHDSFRCHCNYGNDVRQQYANLLSEIVSSHLLSYLLKQVLGRNFDLNLEYDTDLSELVKNSNYALS